MSTRFTIKWRLSSTIAYLERRVAEGHSKRDAIRCLKRYLAREIYVDIQAITTAHPTSATLDTAA